MPKIHLERLNNIPKPTSISAKGLLCNMENHPNE